MTPYYDDGAVTIDQATTWEAFGCWDDAIEEFFTAAAAGPAEQGE